MQLLTHYNNTLYRYDTHYPMNMPVVGHHPVHSRLEEGVGLWEWAEEGEGEEGVGSQRVGEAGEVGEGEEAGVPALEILSNYLK